MKLPAPFIRLPLQFDEQTLQREIEQFDESAWRPHPQGYAGNSALPLVAVNGEPDSDALRGAMAPTPYLERCPYLQQVLASLDVVIGRVRLMRLAGQAEVEAHVDTAYYWWQRVRVHVPIVTQPTVRFFCGDAEINMAPGECWIFDTWRMHRVINDAERSRVHLVVDTIGGDGFRSLVMRGQPYQAAIDGWSPARVAANGGAGAPLRFETQNIPLVMSPWEVREYLHFLLNEANPHPQLALLRSVAMRFDHAWQALWACHGERREGWPEFRRLLDDFMVQIRELAATVRLRNGVLLATALRNGLALAALADKVAAPAGEPRETVATRTPASTARSDRRFERPVFIVSPPRSGSTLLFETLAKAPDVFTIGVESHVLIEGIPELHPRAHDFDSNRLTAADATPEVAAALRERMDQALRDRDDVAPAADARVRVLEKTPKNALRIPFLASVFPEAHFIYLHRDVRDTLSSMIEAWQSGRFRTYPQLPDWSGPAWSLLLVPGWRDLAGRPLHEIVATQWETTMRILLDDLQSLPDGRCSVARYDALLADPQAEISRLCAAVGFKWDTVLDGALPLSCNTVSAPQDQKWRRHADLIEAVLPRISSSVSRARQFGG